MCQAGFTGFSWPVFGVSLVLFMVPAIIFTCKIWPDSNSLEKCSVNIFPEVMAFFLAYFCGMALA